MGALAPKVVRNFGKIPEQPRIVVPTSPALRYEFGPFRLDAGERLLWRGEELVPLTPRVFATLLALVQHSGHPLTKADLLRLVWPDTVVEESSLARAVSTLRQALGDRTDEPRYIETLPWRGYRFVAAVTERAQEPAPIDSLAVLPFLNEGADPATPYLADGITDSLIRRLGLLRHLKVMSRNSVFRYSSQQRSGPPDAEAVGRELGVRAVLLGRVLEAGDGVIVRVELVDAHDGRHLLGAQYQRSLADVVGLQEALAQEIADRLRLRLSGEDVERLARRETRSPEAYQLYLKARYYWNKLTLDGVKRSLELFEQAIQKDPQFALAHVGLMSAHAYLAQPAEARGAGEKALELDPTLGEAHAALAFSTFLYAWDWHGAARGFERAIELSPNHAEGHHWYAIYLANMGRHDEAIREARRAQELDPLSLLMNQTAGNVFLLARQYERAADALLKTIELDANFAAARSVLGFAYAAMGRREQALAEFERVLALVGGNPHVEASVRTFIAYVHASCGDAERARQLLAELADNPAAPAYSLAGAWARVGERDVAFELLERAYREHSFELVSLRVDARLDGLRDDPRFANLLARMKLDFTG
jgi:TolB-like protein/Tfp pilus assembly protein PilF